MLRFIISCFLLLFVSTSVVYGQRFSFGVQAGPNFSTISGDVQNQAFRTGYHVGFTTSLKAFNLVFDANLLYSVQGTENSIDNDRYFENDYILLPVLAGKELLKNLKVYAGPQVSYLVDSDFPFQDIEIDTREFFRRWNLDLIVGTEYKYDRFKVGIRYGLGLLNLNDDPAFFGDGNRLRNQTIQPYFGLDIIKN